MADGGGTRVLCVDDEPDAATSLADVLALAGYQTRACFDGPTALSEAADFRPDFCLLDLNMPRLDGYDLARWLRASLGRSVVLVAVTGSARSDLAERVREAEFDAVLLKPVELSQLLRTLGGTVESSAAAQGPTALPAVPPHSETG